MVVGNGDLASVLPFSTNKLFFASGVSNSQETRESEFDREIELLLDQNSDFHVVYFSSLALFYADNRYTQHKWQMESLVKLHFPRHTIVRIGNITWGENPHTLINYLKAHPDAEIRDEYRYVVDLDEFLYWISLIPDWNVEMNVPGRRLKVREIKNEYAT